MAKICGRAARGDDVGRERFAVLCMMLLIVFHRARSLDEEDSMMRSVESLFGGDYKCMVADRSKLIDN